MQTAVDHFLIGIRDLDKGIEDFEKIRILREKAKEGEAFQAFEAFLGEFTYDAVTKPGAAARMVAEGKKRLWELSVSLAE